MAKFILGNAHRHKALKNSVVRNALWLADFVFVYAVMGIFRLLPVTWASRFGASLGAAFSHKTGTRSRHVRANLSLALPDTPPEEIDLLAREVWRNAGSVLAEYPNLGKIGDPRREHLQIEMDEQFLADRKPDQPMVFAAAHLANWEVIGAAITRMGMRSCAMYAPLANPWLDRKLLAYRKELGCDLVSRDDGLRAFIDALKDGRSPIILTDRRVDTGKPVPFFGELKDTSILPARLALRFGVPLVPVQVERLGGPRFRVRFHAPLYTGGPSTNRDNQAIVLTHRLNQMFEQWITERPGEWLCTRKIWPSSVLRAKTHIYERARTAAE